MTKSSLNAFQFGLPVVPEITEFRIKGALNYTANCEVNVVEIFEIICIM